MRAVDDDLPPKSVGHQRHASMNLLEFPRHLVDVLIPVYNAEATVADSVRSILSQTLAAIRVVVVDDGSTDGTAAILAMLAERDPRIVVHRQPNGGIVDALNNGLALCTGEFLARHDGDDIALPERLEKQLAYLHAHPDCIAVGANAFHIDGSGRRLGSVTFMKNPAWSNVDDIPADEPYLMHPLLMIRRNVLEQVGGYRYVFHAEDTDLYWRLLARGRLHNMEDILAEYRIHPQSVSGKSVLNGRIQAVNSQLAALSERRRAKGLQDLSFPRARLKRFHDAESMQGIMAVAEEELQLSELPQFRLAVAAKLLELESYRPYALDDNDRIFIKNALVRNAALLSAERVRFLDKRQARYVMRLLTNGHLRAAAFMTRPSFVTAMAMVVSDFVKRRFRRLRKRHA